jgi:hypothetical protein
MNIIEKDKAILSMLVKDFIRIETELQIVGYKILEIQKQIKEYEKNIR